MESTRQCLYCQHKEWITGKDRISCTNPPSTEPECNPTAKMVGLWNFPDEFYYSCKTGDCLNFKKMVIE